MTATIHLCGNFYPWIFSTNIQCSNTFRAVYFVGSKSHQVYSIIIYINWNFSYCLGGISKKQYPMFFCNCTYFFNWLYYTSSIIDIHNQLLLPPPNQKNDCGLLHCQNVPGNKESFPQKPSDPLAL